RVKYRGVHRLDEKLLPYVNKKMNVLYAIESEGKLSALKELNYNPIKQCPLCNYKAQKVTKHSFNPHNPIGACSVCNGFGSTLEVDEEKIVDLNKSIKDGGVKLLET